MRRNVLQKSGNVFYTYRSQEAWFQGTVDNRNEGFWANLYLRGRAKSFWECPNLQAKGIIG